MIKQLEIGFKIGTNYYRITIYNKMASKLNKGSRHKKKNGKIWEKFPNGGAG